MYSAQTGNWPCLKLANGVTWEFIATRGTESLIERLATLMELTGYDQGAAIKVIYYEGDLSSEFSPDIDLGQYEELCQIPESSWSITKMRYVHLWRNTCSPNILCNVDKKKGKVINVRRIIQSLYPLYIDVIATGGITTHSALLEYEGKAILISATSGTGKSTCCRRVEAPWKPLCDDEALIVYTKNGYRVHPFPTWNDHIARRSKKTWNVQRHLPLSAIFFLQQYESDKVVPVGKSMAAYSLYRSSLQVFHRYKPFLSEGELNATHRKLFENACEIASATPSFILQASLRGRFWEEMERVII